jgi:2-oxoisovalerate dehydrogenase E1 component
MLADEVQRRCFDDLDQPVGRIHGGEASPNVSKVLERAATVNVDTIRDAFRRIAADRYSSAGLRPVAAPQLKTAVRP